MEQQCHALSWALALLCLLLQLFCTQGFIIVNGPMVNNEIDNFIYGLSYSHDEVLSYNGDNIISVIKNEGDLDGKRNFIVITREKKTAYNGKSDFGVVASNEHLTYPGSLLLANQMLVDNSPDVLAADRAPLTYTVNLPGLIDDGSFKIVPSFSEYLSGINTVLNTWFEKHPTESIVANFQNDFSFAYSQELMRVKFGLEFKNIEIDSSIDFNAMNKQEKLIVIHRFRQIFYTVSVEPTKKPSDLFGSNVTVDELKGKTNNKNPPVIVDSVSYGRMIYVKLETCSTDQEARLLLENDFQTLNNKEEEEIFRKLQNLNLQVYVLGGASEHIELINARSMKEVNDVIVKYSKFSKQNLGFPISYSSQFIKDNSRALVNMATDYVETSRTVYNKGIVTIIHKGWFVMQWEITWNELHYDKNGNPFTTKVNWYRNYEDITAPFRHEIELPGNAQDIHVFARFCTGIAWDWWRPIFDRSGIPLMENRIFTVWGSTFYPEYNISPPV